MGDSDECKLVIVVRTDLQMGKGKIAAQVVVYILLSVLDLLTVFFSVSKCCMPVYITVVEICSVVTRR